MVVMGMGSVAGSTEEYMELLARDERALPELMDYVMQSSSFTMLNHPLVQSIMFNPDKAALQNRQYEIKSRMAEEALKQKDYHKFVFLHERPYRAQALTVVRVMDRSVGHHELIASVWTDSENIWQSQKDWVALLRKLPEPLRMMDDGERAAFDELPVKINVYRGLRNPRWNKLGISWTTDRAKAEWFAMRSRMSDTNACVLVGYVRKQDVLSYFTGRSENEIVVLPAKVRQRRMVFEWKGRANDDPD